MDFLQNLLQGHNLTPLEAALISKSVGFETAPGNEDRLHLKKSREISGKQSLPDCIFVQVARCFLRHPCDVFHLALASKRLWGYLGLEVYNTDVLKAREEEYDLLLISSALQQYGSSLTPEDLMHTRLDSIPEAAMRLRLFQLRPSIRSKRTALHHAAARGNTDVARRAIAAASRFWPGYLDVKHQKCTPLLMALVFNQYDIAELIIEGGCLVDTWHDEPKQARKFVAEGCEFVKGLEIRKGYFKKGSVAYSPLSYAIALRRPYLALLLAEHTKDDGMVPDLSGKLPVLPLHLAAFAGMVSVVRALLWRGHDRSTPSVIFCGATPFEMAVAGVDDNQAIMQQLMDPDLAFQREDLPWKKALIHRSPKNAVFLMRLQHQHRKLSNLTREVQYCLESDELLPVLQWITRNDQSLTIRRYIHDACHRLVDQKIGIGSATTRYLRQKGILEPPKKKTKPVTKDSEV